MEEVFKDINGYEGFYQISNLGRVVSFKRNKYRFLKINLNINKYYLVGLSRDNKQKSFRVHRLVAKAFIPNPLDKKAVNHINGNKKDNTVSNLEWCTYSENMKHSYDVLKRKSGRSKLSRKEVISIREDGRTHLEISKDYNVTRRNITEIKNNKIWKNII